MRCRRPKTIMLVKDTSALPITERAIVTFWFQKLIFASGVPPPLVTFSPQLDFPGPAAHTHKHTAREPNSPPGRPASCLFYVLGLVAGGQWPMPTRLTQVSLAPPPPRRGGCLCFGGYLRANDARHLPSSSRT